jgi:uncharacterized lipoprotein YmbA
MTNILHPRFLACTAAIFFLSFTGCATTGPAKFYTLSSTVNQQERDTARNLTVEVGPVEIPDYLDRPHIVTRTGQNEIMISDFHKWAGSFKDDISRVLVEDLSAQLSTDNVYLYPRAQFPPAQYHVRIKVHRFEGTLGEQVELKAYWSIYGERETELLMKSSSHFHEETGERNYIAAVAAMSRAIEKLSQEIADAIRTLSEQ